LTSEEAARLKEYGPNILEKKKKERNKSLAALRSQLVPTALCKRDGEFSHITAMTLVPGDIIRIMLGNVVPADIILLPS